MKPCHRGKYYLRTKAIKPYYYLAEGARGPEDRCQEEEGNSKEEL